MVTAFGKYCRVLRMERGELLKDMADKIGVQSSFLSAVELGKKNVPLTLRDSIIDQYNLSNEEIVKLDEAIKDSKKVIKFDLEEYNQEDRELLISFAREFPNLSSDLKKMIKSQVRKE